ncbi:hypothetical protein IHQ71_06120 [Rhizobium sp. TH2]|uniref:hypothetical protein n=1 Tax=Rhizobium sp. TH2 TaxID=2775403 RepID=UPI0021570D18|nr:hypothetical protein [Rhizobium sp. TH2]UVC10179.1 hypothetical protein IHQ71_06120 [Rhizobium sp. TH2]
MAGVGATVLALKEIADSVAEVDREARKASVSTRVWQQWTYVATATGMSIDGVTDALKEMNIRGAEFALTGKGSAADAFARLGYSADEVAEKLKDPNRFLDDMIGRLQKLSSAEQALNLDELFGGTGAEQLSKLLGLSVTEIQTLRSEAATFSDEQIAAAKKVDAEWSTMWRNFTIMAKGAAIDGVGVAKSVIEAIRGLKTEGDLAMEKRMTPEIMGKRLEAERLKNLTAQRLALADQIAAVEATPVASYLGQRGIDERNAALADMRRDLAGLDAAIGEVTGEGDKLGTSLKNLDTTAKAVSTSLASNTASAANFKKALTDLKNLVPELKAELDTLAQSSAMDTAYQKAARSATSWGELMQATDIAGRAKSVATFGKHDNILDLIGSVESGGDYNATLDNGRWTGGAQNLTSMTLSQVRDLQRQMLADPANRALYGDGQGSSALGKYQITGRTLEGLMSELGLAGDQVFDQNTQDELARALLRRRGNNPAELRNEWEGLRRVDDSTIRNAYDGTPTARTALDPSDGQKAATDLAKQQDAARTSLNRTVQEGLDLARFEQSISSMSASQQKIELQLYQAQAEAKRNGITLSDAELAKMREKISLTQQLDSKNQSVAASSEGLQNAQKFFAEGFTSSLSGLLTGTQTLQGALQGLLNSLVDAALQAALLGKGPLAGLFGGAAGGSGIFGALLGFSEGGYTGNGGKLQPAGIVHRGEYVMSAVATRRLGAANLEALHTGALKGYASGGYVGNAPAVRRPDLKAGSDNATQAISISAPITVNGSAGTPAQNDDLAKKMRREMEGTMRGLIVSEIMKQRRPGNMLSR